MVDLPRIFTIRERSHRVLNPITQDKLALLGRVLRLPAESTILDLASGKGELLCSWAREHRTRGTGVDISTVFCAAARDRAIELGVQDRVRIVHADASTYVSEELVDLTCCCGATWIGGGVEGTVALLERSLAPGGLMLIGEPFWRGDPPTQEAVVGSHARSREEFTSLPELVGRFIRLGYDLVEMVLADEDSFDRYAAAQWMNLRAFLDANPDDELAGQIRDELDTRPLEYVTYQRRYLGWGVFALRAR